jgi:hypothetical protein
MLSKEIQKKLEQLADLIGQKKELDKRIEALLGYAPEIPEREIEPEPSQQSKKGGYRKPTVPKLTDAEIEKMVRESDEGKTAREIMREYGFKSTSDWYLLKSKYKKQHRQSTATDDMPDHDAADDEEEPEDEPVLVDNPFHISNTTSGAPKRYSYECNCGYSFKSTVPPKLIKCPDCMGKPRLVEEVKEEN